MSSQMVTLLQFTGALILSFGNWISLTALTGPHPDVGMVAIAGVSFLVFQLLVVKIVNHKVEIEAIWRANWVLGAPLGLHVLFWLSIELQLIPILFILGLFGIGFTLPLMSLATTLLALGRAVTLSKSARQARWYALNKEGLVTVGVLVCLILIVNAFARYQPARAYRAIGFAATCRLRSIFTFNDQSQCVSAIARDAEDLSLCEPGLLYQVTQFYNRDQCIQTLSYDPKSIRTCDLMANDDRLKEARRYCEYRVRELGRAQ